MLKEDESGMSIKDMANGGDSNLVEVQQIGKGRYRSFI
jgi:hypothetical protein